MAAYSQRPDLDLSDIIPAYREFLGGSSTVDINYIRGHKDGEEPYVEQTDESADPIPSRLYDSFFNSDDPYLLGHGPETCSTSMGLVSARPLFSWDVNYYYRRLGIPFPYVHAVKGDLSRGYQAGDQDDPLAMYALKQLLNPEVRAEYDAMPLGSTYLNDAHVQQWLKARASAEAGRRTAAMRSAGEDLIVEPKEVLDEWGYDLEPVGLDSQGNLVEDRDEHRQNDQPSDWGYAYWAWRSTWEPDRTQRLEHWQSLMVRALSEAGVTLSLAVGSMGKQPHRYAVSNAQGQWVVYLNEKTEPTSEVAGLAAEALMAAMSKTTPRSTT